MATGPKERAPLPPAQLWAKGLYDFTAEEDEELSFKVEDWVWEEKTVYSLFDLQRVQAGDMMKILEQDPEW